MLENMIHVEVRVKVKAPQQIVWERITDWEAHSQWIPFTKVSILERGRETTGVGTKFVGRTGIGSLAFDDVMTVDRCVSPKETGEDGKCWITKNSPHLKGNADFHVVKIDENNSEIIWIENVSIPNEFIMRNFHSMLSLIGNIAFKLSLSKFARIVERSAFQ